MSLYEALQEANPITLWIFIVALVALEVRRAMLRRNEVRALQRIADALENR